MWIPPPVFELGLIQVGGENGGNLRRFLRQIYITLFDEPHFLDDGAP